eukprot:TRINITY_DN13552_c0_g1_i1.p1 TRINITY_DN13552_c0_g1~~TRINITY_DN13552_c0_g1_i1.p1  ORF type:complete len:789 (+),score=129.39 TRINITY_DN13552_c0_g1_i1:78-2369(+)
MFRSNPVLRLAGRCSCGKSGYNTIGRSSINFITHSSAPRQASGKDSLSMSGFADDGAVTWVEATNSLTDPSLKLQPEGSENPHYFCACDKREYLGVNAQRILGVTAVSQEVASVTGLTDEFKPNFHTFYKSRVADSTDNLPKWDTVPQGTISGGSEVFKKDVLPPTAVRGPEPLVYEFTEVDPPLNHFTKVSHENVSKRVQSKYRSSSVTPSIPNSDQKRDVIVLGGGHNGLVTAAYLAKAGLKVTVLERRHCLGGAAVTEEVVPGFKFSRASYLAGLLRPQIIKDLDLERHGLKFLPRNPSSFTPVREPNQPYLLLGDDAELNRKSIAQFSERDAEAFEEYEAFLGEVRDVIQPLLDSHPPDFTGGKIKNITQDLTTIKDLIRVGFKNKSVLTPFYELFTGSASHLLTRWFDSEILKTTLATDAVIGALVSPSAAGSAYVLLHHVMGEAAGKKGVWAYVQGGMGQISESIARSAREHGAELITDVAVSRIITEKSTATGVELADGTTMFADTIISACSPHHTFLELMPGYEEKHGEIEYPKGFIDHIRHTQQGCGAFKINCAVKELPKFNCYPHEGNEAGPMHMGTIHFESRMEEIEFAYREASMGMPATRPVIEMTIPSSVDKTISPPGQHVVQLFVQFAPYDLDPKVGNWANPSFKKAFVDRCFSIVDEFAPNFSSSIIGYDALSPLDLEQIFGLPKGNIFHGALTLQQLGYARPVPGWSNHRTPIKNLYLGASGTHPGGGVMGAPGRNCARVVLADLGK